MTPIRPSFDHDPASPNSFGSQAQILPHRASVASVYSNGGEGGGMLNYSDLAAQSNGEVDGYGPAVAGYEASPSAPFASSTPRLSTSSGNVNRSVQGQSRYAAAGYAEKARMTERGSGNWNGEKGLGYSGAGGAAASNGGNKKKWIIGAVVAAVVIIAVAVGAGVGVTQSKKSSSTNVANAATAGADSSSSSASSSASSASAASSAAAAAVATSDAADPSSVADEGAYSSDAAASPTSAADASATISAAASDGTQYSTDVDGDIYTLSRNTDQGYIQSTWVWVDYGTDTAAAAEASADGDYRRLRRRNRQVGRARA